MLWENSSAAAAVVVARIFLDKFSNKVVIFIHFSWKMTFWDILYLEGRFLGHILELCRPRRKRLYNLQEINPRWLQMKKCFFMKNWGWDQQLEVQISFVIVKIKFLKNMWKKEDQCTSISHFADRPEVDFWRTKMFQQNRFSENVTCLDFFGGWFGVFPKRFLRMCKDFGLEPRRKMLLGS